MNNNKEIKIRRKVQQLSAAFFALILVIVGCKKEQPNIGENLQGEGLNVFQTDTFTILTYSDEIDSMESDETSVNMLGAYHDPVFGGVNCGFVTQIVPEAFTQDFPELAEITMDSVVLALRFTSINYYANFDDISVEVFEIGDALERDDQTYYTFTEPSIIGDNLTLAEPQVISPDFVKNAIVGEDTLAPQVRIPLDPQLGLDLVADSKAGNMGTNFATSTFRGLYVRVAIDDVTSEISEGQGTILYFVLEDVLSKMTIYYKDGDGTAGNFDFDINSTCARYNKIDHEREGTTVDDAVNDLEVGEEVFYMQGGAIQAVIEFPTIDRLYLDAEGNQELKILNKAELVLPIQDFLPDPFDPATRLFIARIVDGKRSTFTADYGFNNSLSANTVTYDEDNKEFRFIMTREVQALLNGDIENLGYRVYTPAFFASTVERIIFNGPKSTTFKEKPRLEITYTEY